MSHGRGCGVTYASFSKVTVADCKDFSSPEAGVIEREAILPLFNISMRH